MEHEEGGAWWQELRAVAERIIEPLIHMLAVVPEDAETRLEEWGPPSTHEG